VTDVDAQRTGFAEKLERFVNPRGDERLLDVAAARSTLAEALAPLVAEVVVVDAAAEALEPARAALAGRDNVAFLEAEPHALPADIGSFDLSGCMHALDHVQRPEVVVAELTRVTRPGGRILVIDQVAPGDTLAAIELNRFEQERDPTHTRSLSDADFRGLFDANNLVLRRAETDNEERPLGSGERTYTIVRGWYLLVKPGL
jgi:ubiquinone/menaquinone biosynthesis C-methylase UbiE